MAHWNVHSADLINRISEAYYRAIGFLSLFATFLLGFATYKPSSDGVWLLSVILSGIPFWIFFSRVVQPSAERGNKRHRLTFIGAYLTSVFVFVGEFRIDSHHDLPYK